MGCFHTSGGNDFRSHQGSSQFTHLTSTIFEENCGQIKWIQVTSSYENKSHMNLLDKTTYRFPSFSTPKNSPIPPNAALAANTGSVFCMSLVIQPGYFEMLVEGGGFNPSEKYARPIGSSPPTKGVKK